MRVSWSWLGELVDLAGLAPDEVAARLTLAGLEVEGVHRLGEGFSGVVVGEVRAARPHPQAQKLTLVTVSAGDGTAEVVCGAPNVPAPGGKVLWARPGARLPAAGGEGNREIAAKELRGVMSAGMLCSWVELLGADLGTAEAAGGIVVLAGEDAAAAPGADAAVALGLKDVALEIGVTANRGDCLGHLGVAREVAALFGRPLRRPDASLDAVTGDRDVSALCSVAIADAAACPRYVARVIEGLAIRPSPRWLRRRLEAVGVRPISNLVDVTNYVMFELAHPLHAFDYDKVQGGRIIVRRAAAGERMHTLDGVERLLEPEDVLITDPRGPVALAGVMGGGGSEIAGATTRVLLESATFDPRAIRRTARRVQLHSESSHRFERGVDPNGVDFASARAARLLAELGGGRVCRGVVDAYPVRRAPLVLDVRPARVRGLLGVDVPPGEIARHLAAIELGPELGDESGGGLRVTVPTFRPDLEREVDLIEEVARLRGFDGIPATLPASEAAPRASGDPLVDRVKHALAAAGLDEAITYGFTSPARIAALRLPPGHPASRPLVIKNPMREEHGVLRTSLVPNLLAALAHNLSFTVPGGVPGARLFEVGHVFLPSGRELPDEPRFVAGLVCGARDGWLTPGDAFDFADVRGVLEQLFDALGLAPAFAALRNEEGFLHPGVAAVVSIAGERVGVVGEVHPDTRERSGVDRPCFAFEINLERLPPLRPARFAPIARFPAISRDVSFFVDDFVPAARVRDVLDEARAPLVEDIRVLEDYREPGKVPPGKKGMLWSLTYRAGDRTLTDAEVDAIHEGLVARLLSALRAERR